jgi:hypothetical protein
MSVDEVIIFHKPTRAEIDLNLVDPGPIRRHPHLGTEMILGRNYHLRQLLPDSAISFPWPAPAF